MNKINGRSSSSAWVFFPSLLWASIYIYIYRVLGLGFRERERERRLP
jgi:hypothetical protein